MRPSKLVVAFVFMSMSVFGQNKALQVALNEEGSHYLKATFLNQVWLRYTHNNPGTTIHGYPQNETYDVGLRRTRIQVFGQISERVFFYTQIGTNNLSYNGTRKQGLFFHDALGELKLVGDHLSVGAGLTAWSGLSRYASPSISSILTLDVPLYQQATNDVSDQFIRKFSVYAKGKLNKLDYRFAITKPMSVAQSNVQNTPITANALFSPEPSNMQLQSYVMFQFLDKESNLTPYNVGSYLGSKNVVNVGAGFIYQSRAMWHSKNDGRDTVRQDLFLVDVDFFFDHILNAQTNTAITAYASVSMNNFGKNYFRNVGVMNPADGLNNNEIINGAGNAFPMIGTGTTFYLQTGYLFKKGFLGKLGTLQPFGSLQYSTFDYMKRPMLMYELGYNWLIEGHRTKISFNYQSRPVFKRVGIEEVSLKRKGMFVTQMQISI